MANIEIGGRLHSTATGNVVAGANEIYDDAKGKKQSVVNQETDAALDDRYTKSQTYNKTELNNMITTPNQKYVTVTATDQTTAVTDVLPATGSADTVYRVGSWNGTQYEEGVYSEYSWNGSTYIHLSTKTEVGEVYDISAAHATGEELATYADLAAALGTNGANIPQSLRKGGMSVKFVKSSDNKYIQFRCIADKFTTDTTQWAIADESVYVENPEFIYVKTDAEGKILWAIKADGSIYYGAGVPQQVIDYIEEKIADLSLDEYEDIVAFLDGLEEGDKTLQTLLNEKVDKEEGKSLIDTGYASSQSATDNPEYLQATTDSEDKILEGIQQDGTKVIGGDLNVGGSAKILGEMKVSGVSYKVIENTEFVYTKTDSEDKILWAIRTDGSIYYGAGVPQQVIDYIEEKLADLSLDEYEDIVDFLNGLEDGDKTLQQLLNEKVDKVEGKSLIDAEYASSQSAIENPEYIEVTTDSEDKILAGRTPDGAAFEKVGFATPKVSIAGHIIENIEDLEGKREITLDSEERIISYRKADGTLVENVELETPKVYTNSLELTEQGMSDFQQALKDSGFQPGGGSDWSDREVIELPEPEHYALLDIAVSSLPLNDGQVSEGYITYYDGLGNYFKIECSLEPQGQSSRIFARTGGKGNYTLDLPKDIKFGSWVPQDSFHLKGAAKDVTKCYLPTSYKWAYKVMNYLNAKPNRVLSNDGDITYTNATGDRFTDWGDSARCISDGFPVEVYLNGEYWGLYNWQLKKNRKNYSMDKKDYTSFFLDADKMMSNDYTHGIWNDGPDAVDPDGTYPKWWNGFDIKGPNKLLCMDGSIFDGDHPKELIDETSPYWASADKKQREGSATTKALIRGFQTKYLEVKTLIDNNDIEGAKAKFNENFDYNACMLVYIFNSLMRNGDSVKKNTLWGTYKEGKIVPMLWDLDGVYGEGWIGNSASAPSTGIFNAYNNAQWPLKLLWDLYETEIKNTYCDLREQGIISIETWREIVFGWINRVGIEAYNRDIKKWPETPSYRKNYTNTDYWQEVGTTTDTQSTPLWNDSTNYNIDDQCRLSMGGSGLYMIYKAVSPNTNVCPVTAYYEGFPNVGGYYNSPKRMEKWMLRQIELCDSFCGYNE